MSKSSLIRGVMAMQQMGADSSLKPRIPGSWLPALLLHWLFLGLC